MFDRAYAANSGGSPNRQDQEARKESSAISRASASIADCSSSDHDRSLHFISFQWPQPRKTSGLHVALSADRLNAARKAHRQRLHR
jgi:hypothetical protein